MEKLIVLCFLIVVAPLLGQNIVPNGDFESGEIPCENLGVLHEDLLDDWYAATGSGLSYNRVECERRINDNLVLPHEGNGNLMISGTAWVNGMVQSTMVMVDFPEPLNAGQTYILEFYGKSIGISHVPDIEPKACGLGFFKKVNIYLGRDDEFGINREFGEHVPIDISPFGNFRQKLVTVDIAEDEDSWTKYSACFEAEGGETKLIISGPFGSAQDMASCRLYTDEELDEFDAFTVNRILHFFYFQIDDLTINDEIPVEISTTKTICEAQFNTVNLNDYLPEDDSNIFWNAVFTWPDGSQEAIRELEDGGLFEIDVDLICSVKIPLILDIQTESCSPPFYIPNAFSPNADGINDQFKPLLNDFYELTHYDFSIYDRWGQEVFQSNNPDLAWDGRTRGKISQANVYIWQLNYQLAGFSRAERQSGSVSLIR